MNCLISMNNSPHFTVLYNDVFTIFIWGVWYVPMWKFLGNVEGVGDWKLWSFLTPVGLAYASTGIAAMVSPFIVGMIADRFFSQVVGILHLFRTVFLYLTSQAQHFKISSCVCCYLLCYIQP